MLSSQDPSPLDEPTPRDSYIRPLRQARVIFVEDDPHDRALLARAADDEGRFSTTFVNDGATLLQLLQRAVVAVDGRLPDLVVLDLPMPRIDGIDTLRILETDPRLRQLPVVFLTGAPEAARARCAGHGARLVLRKPDDYAGLCHLMARLDRQRLLRLPAP